MVVYKNYIFIICSCLTIVSCCYNGKYSANGLPRKKVKEFPDKNISIENIDTLSIYKLKINFAINGQTNQYIYFEKEDDNTYPYVSYLKFYKNNKLGLFIIPKADTLKLSREYFNPSKAKMGYYYISNKSIKTKISTIGDCSLYISKKNGTINGDSIIIKDNSNHGNIYLKQNIPKEYLENWKPDW